MIDDEKDFQIDFCFLYFFRRLYRMLKKNPSREKSMLPQHQYNHRVQLGFPPQPPLSKAPTISRQTQHHLPLNSRAKP